MNLKHHILLLLSFLLACTSCLAKQWIMFCATGNSMDWGHAYMKFISEDPNTGKMLEPKIASFGPQDGQAHLVPFPGSTNFPVSPAVTTFYAEVTDDEWLLCNSTAEQWSNKTHFWANENCVAYVEAVLSNLKDLTIPKHLDVLDPTDALPVNYINTLKKLNLVWDEHSRLSYQFSIDNPTLSAGARLMFDPEMTSIQNGLSLTAAEKQFIYNDLAFKVTKDHTKLIDNSDDDEFCPFTCVVSIADINNDGKPEIFIEWGDRCTSGIAGGEIAIYTKELDGKLQTILRTSGMGPMLLHTSSNGFPDLMIGTTQMKAPVVRWNGTEYKYFKIVPFGKNTAPPYIAISKFIMEKDEKKN